MLWAYRNTSHESTKEKPSFLLFGIDLRSPTEAALLPPDPISHCDCDDYREELMVSISSARELAVASIREAQRRYKGQYDKGERVNNYRVGDWVFVKFPAEESGKNRKMSRPWRGPFRVLERRDPNLTLRSVFSRRAQHAGAPAEGVSLPGSSPGRFLLVRQQTPKPGTNSSLA